MASFTIDSSDLKKIISQIEPMLKGNINGIPKVLFSISGGKISVSATNGDAYIKVSFESETLSDGEFVISGEKLARIAKQNTSKSVKFELENNTLIITAGNYSYGLALLDTRLDIFDAPEFDGGNTFTILAQDLKSAIVAVNCCIDSAKAHLNCVMIHSDSEKKNQLNIVATDGMRLGVVERKAIYDVEVPNLMIPKKAADYILTIIGDMSGEITIKYTDNMIQLSTGSILYTSKLLDTNFPKYQSVIPVSNNKILEAKVADMRDAIKQTSSMMEITFRIKMNIEPDKVRVSCEDNGDTAKGEFAATYSQTEPMEIICNFKLLMDILEKISSTDVRIQIMDPTTPLLIRSVSDETIRYVFMPFVSR